MGPFSRCVYSHRGEIIAFVQVQAAAKRWSSLIEVLCFIQIMLLCLSTRLFPFIRGESTIYDFDPYFNHRATKFLAKEGFSEFWNWYDDGEPLRPSLCLGSPHPNQPVAFFFNLCKVLSDSNAHIVTFAAASWYPLGRPSGQTLFPGLMTTSYLFHKILSFCGIIVSVYDVSCYLPPFFSCLTALVVHCFTKHASGSRAAGLFAALFVGISPAYVKTSLVGSYDNECIAIFAMICGFYMWTRAVKRGTMISALLAALPSAYMVSAWGGYVFLINAIAIHVFALCVLGLITPKHEVAYIVFYVIITACCINIPFLNFTPLWSSEHMASHGVFVLVIASAVARFASSLVPKDLVKDLQAWVIGLAGLLILIVLLILALTVIQVEGVGSPLFSQY